MKIKPLIAVSLFFIMNFSAKSQIVLDTTIQTWNLIGFDFYPVQISDYETKYFFQDTLNNTFNLYNLDFSPFLLNVAVPEPFSPFVKQYSVIYISRSLFDCDSTNIEYAYAAQAGPGANRKFYIMRTNGTELFSLDSALAPYLFGTLNGSQNITPIINSPQGAKLFLYYPNNTNNLRIYSLCGNLPTGMNHPDISNRYNSFVKVYPNPSTGEVFFDVFPPDNIHDFNLNILSSNGSLIFQNKINYFNNKYNLSFNNFDNGTYYFSLSNEQTILQGGKFIIMK